MFNQGHPHTTTKKAATYDTINPLLHAIYIEFKELSKKKPEGALSKNKVKICNRLMEKCKFILDGEETSPYLDLLDEDDLPQYSDVAIILSQYQAAMAALYEKYYIYDRTTLTNYWNVKPK